MKKNDKEKNAKLSLYDITALLKCSTVIAATSEAAALAEVGSWSSAWYTTGSLVGVQDTPEVIRVQQLPPNADPAELADVIVESFEQEAVK